MGFSSPPWFAELERGWQPNERMAEWAGVGYRSDDLRPVGGAMAGFLGRRFGVAELLDTPQRSYELEQGRGLVRDVISVVRAFPVNSVLGAFLEASGESHLQDRLGALLDGRCPGIAWQSEGELSGPLRKYGLLHGSLSAPVDETTGQPMALELFAEVTRLGGEECGPGGSWFDRWRSRHGDAYDETPVDEPIELRILAATYANVLYPGIGVGEYL